VETYGGDSLNDSDLLIPVQELVHSIYGKWSIQASKQANIHMHGCNEVTLVLGRLGPLLLLLLVTSDTPELSNTASSLLSIEGTWSIQAL